MERLCDLRERGGLDAAAFNRHLELVRLPRVARVDGAHEAPPLRRDAGPLEHRRAPLLERGEGSFQGLRLDGGRTVQGLHVVAFQIGPDESERRKRAGNRRADHLGDAELARERRGVQRPCTAESGEGEVPRIMAALNRDDL